MFERIYTDHYGGEGLISIDTDETHSIVISKPQALQLIVDLQKLVDGDVPDDESCIEGVT